jgi:hypothetical protein
MCKSSYWLLLAAVVVIFSCFSVRHVNAQEIYTNSIEIVSPGIYTIYWNYTDTNITALIVNYKKNVQPKIRLNLIDIFVKGCQDSWLGIVRNNTKRSALQLGLVRGLGDQFRHQDVLHRCSLRRQLHHNARRLAELAAARFLRTKRHYIDQIHAEHHPERQGQVERCGHRDRHAVYFVRLGHRGSGQLYQLQHGQERYTAHAAHNRSQGLSRRFGQYRISLLHEPEYHVTERTVQLLLLLGADRSGQFFNSCSADYSSINNFYSLSNLIA